MLSLVLTLCDPMDYSPPGSFVHGESPGKNTGVGCHALHQGIFPTQGLNPDLPHCRQILYCLSHQGSPIHLTATGNHQISNGYLQMLRCMHAQLLSRVWLFATRLFCPWDYFSTNTEMDCPFLLQGIFQPKDQTHISCISCIGRRIPYYWDTRETLDGILDREFYLSSAKYSGVISQYGQQIDRIGSHLCYSGEKEAIIYKENWQQIGSWQGLSL